MQFVVEWQVSGESTVNVTEAEMAEWGVNRGDFTDLRALLNALNSAVQGDIYSDLVNDFDTRDAPVILSVDVEDEYEDEDEWED